MRWERFFDDLEAQLDEAERAERDAEMADRTRREVGRQLLSHRLRAEVGRAVVVRASGGMVVRGVVRAAGAGWLLVSEQSEGSAHPTGLDLPGRPEALVSLQSVLSVRGLGVHAIVPGAEGAVEARLGLGYVLRDVAHERSPVVLTLTDGSSATGLIRRVGADFIDLTEPAGDERLARRTGPERIAMTVPFSALSVVRSVRG